MHIVDAAGEVAKLRRGVRRKGERLDPAGQLVELSIDGVHLASELALAHEGADLVEPRHEFVGLRDCRRGGGERVDSGAQQIKLPFNSGRVGRPRFDRRQQLANLVGLRVEVAQGAAVGRGLTIKGDGRCGAIHGLVARAGQRPLGMSGHALV